MNAETVRFVDGDKRFLGMNGNALNRHSRYLPRFGLHRSI